MRRAIWELVAFSSISGKRHWCASDARYRALSVMNGSVSQLKTRPIIARRALPLGRYSPFATFQRTPRPNPIWPTVPRFLNEASGMHTFRVRCVFGAFSPSPPACGGRGRGPRRKAREGEVGRAADRSLRFPPPHPDPLRPQGRRGGYLGSGCVHASTRAAESATLKLP
jgi:hypothetical protein